MVNFLKLNLLLFSGGLHYNLWAMAYKTSWYPTFWMKSWENSWAMAQVHLFLVCINSTKEQTNDFLVAHLFFIPTILKNLFTKFECCENKIGCLLTRSITPRDPHM
jgi:hypothetical protein